MKQKELLKPRYKVVADYPHSPFEIGNILETDDKGEYTVWNHDGKDYITLNDYPEIFKMLKWWEERDLKDMPKHVRYVGNITYTWIEPNQVIKGNFKKVTSKTRMCDISCCGLVPWIFEPATEEEYLKYNKSNE